MCSPFAPNINGYSPVHVAVGVGGMCPVFFQVSFVLGTFQGTSGVESPLLFRLAPQS